MGNSFWNVWRYADSERILVFFVLFFCFLWKCIHTDVYTYQLTIYGFYIEFWQHTTDTGWIDWLDFTYISLKLRICFCTTRMFTKATGTKMFVFWVYVTAIHPNKTFFHFYVVYPIKLKPCKKNSISLVLYYTCLVCLSALQL